jgi:RND family efflux transporter MFP subunit
VRAPYAGQVNQRKVTLGTYVEDKTTIATIADLRRIRLVGWVPEKAAPTARELLRREELRRACRLTGAALTATVPLAPLTVLVAGERLTSPDDFNLEFTLNAYPKQTFRARIFYMSTVASPDTHMFECKAEVDARGLDAELRPGLSARIRCPLRGNPNACVVPEESVRATERGFIAFVPVRRKTKDGKDEWIAQARELKLGYRSAGSVEVQQGIAPGEWIVRKGAEALEEGTPIRFPEAQLEEVNHRGTESTEGRNTGG